MNARSALILYGDERNGNAFARLLEKTGLRVSTAPPTQAQSALSSSFDLVVALACCSAGKELPTWPPGLLDACGHARVLACSNAGAVLFQTKDLLIGNPNGWHATYMPKRVVFPATAAKGFAAQLLTKPNHVADPNGEVVVTIHAGSGTLQHIGIYDTGRFPKGTVGIGREENDLHHWMICKQGNYALWGADSTCSALTPQGTRLFANLCWHLVHAKPQPLVFPAKKWLKAGVHNAVLVGGSRNVFWINLRQPGQWIVQLRWNKPNKMMMIVTEPAWQREDGESPLTISQRVTKKQAGKESSIHIGSFDLSEGKRCPYTLTITRREA